MFYRTSNVQSELEALRFVKSGRKTLKNNILGRLKALFMDARGSVYIERPQGKIGVKIIFSTSRCAIETIEEEILEEEDNMLNNKQYLIQKLQLAQQLTQLDFLI